MATVYAGNSGYVFNYRAAAWSTVRDSASGSSSSDIVANSNVAIRTQHFSGRGGQVYYISRSFFYFDTSGITGTVSSATLKIYGYSLDSADIIAIKSTAFGGDGGSALDDADFSEIDFSTAYSSELATWSTSGYNDITLNATALGDMKNNNAFIVCLVEHDHDYSDSAVSSADLKSGCYYDPETGTSKDPYIDYTLATGYGNKVLGVTASNIAKVDGVATANIEKVIGV